MKSLDNYLNKKIRQAVLPYIDKILEIRLRVNRPIIINLAEEEKILEDCCVLREDIKEVFDSITEYSAYAFEENMADGYISLPGGHRVGVGGYITKNTYGTYIIKDIKFLNFRVRHFVEGCSDEVFKKMLINGINNTIIISPPALGKTTLLRDLIRNISYNIKRTSISVVDERNEIGGCFKGEPTIDLGPRTDIISNCPKFKGVIMAVRSMSPNIIAVDEIGNKEENKALKFAETSGVKIIATIHGSDIGDARDKLGEDVYNMFENKIVIKGIGEYICY